MQRNTVLILLVRFNVESYKVVKSDQLLVQGGRVPVRQVEKQCGRDLPSRHCQDRTQLEQLDMWQEARYVVQVSASTANHDLNSGRAHHGHGVHEKLQIPARAGARVPREKWGTAGARGGDRGPRDAGTPFRSTFLLRSLCCSLLRQKSPRFKAGAGCCCGGGFYRCWWWAEHTARLRANIHSVSALLPGACVPCCCT